jgi:hypothetical protein
MTSPPVVRFRLERRDNRVRQNESKPIRDLASSDVDVAGGLGVQPEGGMVDCARALLEVTPERLGCPGVENSNDPIALGAIDLDRGEGLGATLAAQLAPTCRSKVANPVRDPVLRHQIQVPVDLPRDERDFAWRAGAPIRNFEDGGDPDP